MSKLGYTWYPKDFKSDPDVMMMSCAQRGIYRDLIDLAYMKDNCIKFNVEQLARYCGATVEEVESVLEMKGEKDGEFWRIPSCQKRIDLSSKNKANGSKGGRPKNPNKTQTKTQSITQTERQREYKEKENRKEKKIEKQKKPTPSFSENIIEPYWVDPMRNPNNTGLKSRIFREWERVRKGYVWQEDDIEHIENIKHHLTNRFKRLNPTRHVKNDDLITMLRRIIVAVLADDFWSTSEIKTYDEKFNKFAELAKKNSTKK